MAYDQSQVTLCEYLYFENTNVMKFEHFIEYPEKRPAEIEYLIPRYKNKNDFVDFQSDVKSNINKLTKMSFWGFVEFEIDIIGNIENLKTFSLNDSFNHIIMEALSKTGKFTRSGDQDFNKPVFIFFPIIKQPNDEIIIPNYDYSVTGLQLHLQ
jgi:hypothetical protein